MLLSYNLSELKLILTSEKLRATNFFVFPWPAKSFKINGAGNVCKPIPVIIFWVATLPAIVWIGVMVVMIIRVVGVS